MPESKLLDTLPMSVCAVSVQQPGPVMQRYVQPIPAEKACTTVVLVIPTIVSPDPDPIISVSLFLYLLS